MKKKLLATLMALTCTVSLAACGGTPVDNSSTPGDSAPGTGSATEESSAEGSRQEGEGQEEPG